MGNQTAKPIEWYADNSNAAFRSVIATLRANKVPSMSDRRKLNIAVWRMLKRKQAALNGSKFNENDKPDEAVVEVDESESDDVDDETDDSDESDETKESNR